MNNKNFSSIDSLPAQDVRKQDSTSSNKFFSVKLGLVLCSALLGYTSYGQPSVSVGVSVPLPSVKVSLPGVEIRAESDFYEPLTPHGEWVVVGSYGRCWRPGRVARDWRPYCNGNWERTDAGWYWVSDEPWAWATYHYGRWDFTDEYGWYWVPQTQWAPAWVSWHSGGGYVGWAPLLPSVRISASGFIGFNVAVISPRAFVFVEQRRFLDPIRPTTVVVNNTTIINNTTTISNTRIVNNTVINEGPATAVIEKASGRKVQAVAAHELRHKTEASVAKQGKPAAANKKQGDAPASKKVQKPAATTDEPAAPTPKKNEVQSEKHRAAPAAPEIKRETRPEGKKSPAIKEPTQPKSNKRIEKQEKPAKSSDQKIQQPAREQPNAGEKSVSKPTGKDKDHEKKSKE